MKPSNFEYNWAAAEPKSCKALLKIIAIALLAGIATLSNADTVASLCQMPSIDPAKLHLMFHDNTSKTEMQTYVDRVTAVMPCSQQPIIPKIIHQIWIGPKPLSDLHKAYMSTWKKHHPDWKYKLWTDADVENWQGTFHLKDLYDRSYLAQEKADILRLNIIYRYGGLYADVDIACLKSFDALHHRYDFYASASPPRLGLFASKPHNSLFPHVFNSIAQNWDEAEARYLKNNESIKRDYYLIWLAVVRTQQRFGQEVKNYCASNSRCILLPDRMLYYDIHYQMLWCTALKALKTFPTLKNWSDNMFVISNAMSANRKSRVRSTALYNNIDKKIKIEETKVGPISRLRNWIHNNIDVCFVGCE